LSWRCMRVVDVIAVITGSRVPGFCVLAGHSWYVGLPV
jgi:hypothetical protein